MARKERQSSSGVPLLLVGAMFVIIPSIIGFFLINDELSDKETGSWPEVPMSKISGSVEIDHNDENPYTPVVSYEYSFQQRSYQGDSIWRKRQSFSDYTEAWLPLKQVLEMNPPLCRVNPAQPSEAALLEKEGEVEVYLGLAFISVFLLVGLLLVYSGLRAIKGKPFKAKSSPKASKSSDGKGCLLVFGGIFFLAGIIAMWALSLGPYIAEREAQNWTETPCRILHSELKTFYDSDGNTYRVEIFYEYVFNEQEYKSNRYSFNSTSTNIGVDHMRSEVKRYRKGKSSVCYVNPESPWEAVLIKNRGIVWYEIGFTSIFVLVGGSIMAFGIFGGKKKAKQRIEEAESAGPSSRVLAPGKKRSIKFLSVGIFAAIWNSFVWGLMYDEAPFWFFCIFASVGALVAFATFYELFNLFRGRVTIRLANDGCALGDSLMLTWNTQSTGIERLIITVQLIEKASYRRGTNSRTDTCICWVGEILDSEDPVDINSGRIEIPLPEDLMPSWTAENNAIEWKIMVEGKLKSWGKIKDEYIITILEKRTW